MDKVETKSTYKAMDVLSIIRVDLKWNATFGAMLSHTGDSVAYGIISPETSKMVNTVRIMAQFDQFCHFESFILIHIA